MYEPTWDSLKKYTVPQWFMDAKLGIFIHWGVYAVPAFDNEWYPRFMYQDKPSDHGPNYYRHHLETHGHPGTFGYKDFIPMFKGENWDPAAWVDLFAAAGARYVVPVAEHHDGFAMYATEFTPWNAAEMGPKRDVIGELGAAVRAAGLHFGVSTHRAFNWRYYSYRDDFDTVDPANAALYSPRHDPEAPAPDWWLEDWHARTNELIHLFEPELLYFDFGWHADEFAPYRPEILAHYYNQALTWGKEVVLLYKDKIPDGAAVLDVERSKLDHLRPLYWQADTSVSFKSWSYIEDDEFKTVDLLVHNLVDIVSKNGNLLLNVGPRADGTIPEEAADLLRGLGQWLEVNGEAIYGTRPWHVYGEGPAQVAVGHLQERQDEPFTAQDIRFTRNENTLYAIALGWPGERITIHSLGTGSPLAAEKIVQISLLAGDGTALSWAQDAAGLTIALPLAPIGAHAYVFKIRMNE